MDPGVAGVPCPGPDPGLELGTVRLLFAECSVCIVCMLLVELDERRIRGELSEDEVFAAADMFVFSSRVPSSEAREDLLLALRLLLELIMDLVLVCVSDRRNCGFWSCLLLGLFLSLILEPWFPIALERLKLS